MTRSLVTQLRDAWKGSGITLEELRERANAVARAANRRDDTFAMTLESMSRKLAGKQILTTHECEVIAQALAINLVWTPEATQPTTARRARAS